MGSCLLARLFALGFDFFFQSIMNIDFIRCSGSVVLTTLAPIVTTGVGKEVALSIECRTGNRSLNGREGFQSLFVV
jgi:hypothetical protein